MSQTVPLKKLAVYYGWPIAVNGTWSVAAAVEAFDAYDAVVFGAGLELSTHPEYTSTKSIIDQTTAKVYGYINAVLSQSAFETAVDNWVVMGGATKVIDGIFCDQFGFDYGLTRTVQNREVDYIHGKTVNSHTAEAFVNAWDPDDVFKKSAGKDHHLTASDIYLAESHYVINGAWQSVTDWKTKSNKMITYHGTAGTQMACVTTTTPAIGFVQDNWDNANAAHTVCSFQLSGWGEPYFSAGDALLPFRTRPTLYGNKLTGTLSETSGVFEHATNVGIHLDTNNHTFSTLLD